VDGASIWIDAVEIADIDAEFQGAGGDDNAIAALGECFFGL
jgi:hypothetical protein